MNCLGAASAAKVPVKRYKALVAELYVHTAKSTDAEGDLDPSVARGINKLVEYLDRNPHRIPKVRFFGVEKHERRKSLGLLDWGDGQTQGHQIWRWFAESTSSWTCHKSSLFFLHSRCLAL